MKQDLIHHITYIIRSRKEELLEAIRSAKESRDNDSKSSVGDKHETSRALIQTEIDKLEIQLDKTLHLEKEISAIHPKTPQNKKVEKGSLVFTNQENYFISIGLGKINLDDKVYYAISEISPVGKMLMNKKKGDRILFNGREIEIREII